jgi:HNH endonuclease
MVRQLAKEFNTDAKYLAWCREHPSGLVGNTLKSPNTAPYFVVHTARCGSITKGSRPGEFTERLFTKACAPNAGALKNWIATNRPDQLAGVHICQKCRPNLGSVAEGRPPIDVQATSSYREGAVVRVETDRFERDKRARAACLAHFGRACQACGLAFADRYGPDTADLIHVHHIVPLSQTRREHSPNPVRHMVPVCPNCHFVIHRNNPPKSISAVRRLIATAERRRQGRPTPGGAAGASPPRT